MTISPVAPRPRLCAFRESNIGTTAKADTSRSPALMHCSDEAARLLLKVSELASRELTETYTFSSPSPPRRTISFILPQTDLRGSVTPDSPISSGYERISKRSRTVSICSMDSMGSEARRDGGLLLEDTGAEEDFVTTLLSDSEGTTNELTKTTPTKKFVGTSTQNGAPLLAVLRPKFSWKSFPELEQFLINHRSKYLEFSSEHNYTRDQKLYNNKLTQDLISLATSSGYVFEGFTFAAIRDRIR